MNTDLKQPHITTLTIEVSVVKIGNNKMTLSVFDQLYSSKPYDDFYKIIYPIWGKVKRPEYEYVIFQKDNELRKMMIPDKKDIFSFDESLRKSTVHSGGYGIDLVSARLLFNSWLSQPGNSYAPDIHMKFFDSLNEGHRNIIIDEYNNKANPLKTFNEMVDLLTKSNQLFIAV